MPMNLNFEGDSRTFILGYRTKDENLRIVSGKTVGIAQLVLLEDGKRGRKALYLWNPDQWDSRDERESRKKMKITFFATFIQQIPKTVRKDTEIHLLYGNPTANDDFHTKCVLEKKKKMKLLNNKI